MEVHRFLVIARGPAKRPDQNNPAEVIALTSGLSLLRLEDDTF